VRYIAKEIGVSVHTVYSITKSKPTTYRIDFETLLKLCECLNIVVTDVFYDAWQINIFKADEPDLYVLIDDLFTDKNEAKKVALEVLKGYEGCDYELIGMTHEGEVN
jgi:DNA-binding XRE family transcriptional regulator